MEEDIQEEEKAGFFSRIKNIFSKNEDEEEKAPQYSRKLLDGRIEKYLDRHLDSYIDEYQIVTQLDLDAYESRYDQLTGRVSGMKEYMITADAVVSSMENDLVKIDKTSKGGKKK
ncbi:MAG: hypothetical protein R6V01_07785 [Thermoplasmatota archaeon]